MVKQMTYKYIMVDTISQFRIRYVIETPEGIGQELIFKDGTRSFPCTPEDWAKDTVTCEEAKEFTQEYIGESILSTREVTLQEAIDQFREDEPVLGCAWDDKTIIKNHITKLNHTDRCTVQLELFE